MKTIKILFLIPVAVMILLFFSEKPAPEDSKNLFSSGIYASYGLPAHSINEHMALLEKWRAEGVAHQLYHTPNPKEAQRAFLYSLTEPDDLLIMLETLKRNPAFNSTSEKPAFEDQMLLANLPSHLATISGIQVLRLAQPVTAKGGLLKWVSSPALSPEFSAFLKSTPKHLYINLMKRDGVEKPFTKTLEQAEQEYPSLYVITLDKDSAFYHQETKEPMNTLQFLKSFEEHLSGNRYFFTSKVEKPDFHALLLQVQNRYFPIQTALDQNERKDLIELFYLALMDAYLEKISPSTMNISCRQCLDRGPSLSALWLLHQGAIDEEEAYVQLLAPPLLFHNRPSHKSRLERFQSARSRM